MYIGGSGGGGGGVEVVGGGGWKAVRKHTLANSLAYVQQQNQKTIGKCIHSTQPSCTEQKM